MEVKKQFPLNIDSEYLKQKILSRTRKTRGCWYWEGNKKGRGNLKYLGVKLNVARWVYWIFREPFDFQLLVLHICDNPRCIRPSHLFLGTTNDNVQDMMRKGRHVISLDPKNPRYRKGSESANSKLHESDILKIRKDMRSRKKIAMDFGVHKSTISAIKTGRTWSHV